MPGFNIPYALERSWPKIKMSGLLVDSCKKRPRIEKRKYIFYRRVEKCIADLAKKDDLTPQETKALLDGFQVRDWICEEIEECKMKDEYSERGYSRRMSRNGSYGMPMRGYRHYGYSDYPGYPREHMNASYCDPSDPYYYDGNGNGNGGSYSEGQHSMRGRDYSRHSIGDRIVAMMEKEMDHTESDYEKEQLHKFIRMIRMAADEG